MNDVEREKIIDARVQRRLATDAAYRNAESADAQAEREQEIVDQVERELGLLGPDLDELALMLGPNEKEIARRRELAAELLVLEHYDRRRQLAGHDFGCGQRGGEIMRRRRELERLGGSTVTHEGFTRDELAAAWRRIMPARLRRARREAELYRSGGAVRTLYVLEALDRAYNPQRERGATRDHRLL